MGLDFAPVMAPYLDKLRSDLGGFELFDAHTHIGRNDPDGFRSEPEDLLARLEDCDARSFVFPMHEPDGYAAANDEVLAAALASGGRMTAFCRVNPNDGDAAVTEARRVLDAGARGIKLHPRAEAFTLATPAVDGLVAIAHERGLPVLIHAGRGIPALGRDTILLSERHPSAKLILAHAGISDLSWLWRVLPDHPNVFIDTSWWNPADLVALFALVPPGQILWASDAPYDLPMVSATWHLRCAVQAGLGPEQVRGIAGAQAARIAAGEDPLDLGPPPPPQPALAPTLERVVTHLCAAVGQLFKGAEHQESVALARLACAVDPGDELAPQCDAVLELLDRAESQLAPPPAFQPFPESVRYITSALCLARTPAAGLP